VLLGGPIRPRIGKGSSTKKGKQMKKKGEDGGKERSVLISTIPPLAETPNPGEEQVHVSDTDGKAQRKERQGGKGAGRRGQGSVGERGFRCPMSEEEIPDKENYHPVLSLVPPPIPQGPKE